MLGGPSNSAIVEVFNIDYTAVNPLIPTPTAGMRATISAGDSEYAQLSSASRSAMLEYLCKFIYHDNGKVFISRPDVRVTRNSIVCQQNGQLKTFNAFTKVSRITKKLSLRYNCLDILHQIYISPLLAMDKNSS